MIEPGKTIGVFGGGQLGRMFALAARRMGYGIRVYEPAANCPAGQVADVEINAPYRPGQALDMFLEGLDAATFEFENIPADFLEAAARRLPVYPAPAVLLTCQNREREKTFLRQNGFPHARFAVVSSANDLAAALEDPGRPGVLKTADFGYDGKGQVKVNPGDDPAEIWETFGGGRGVYEEWIDYQAELSVICASGANGETACFPASENIHTRHILDFSIVPARLPEEILAEAARLATAITRALGVTGLLAVEFFLTRDGRLLVNEMAPRPHNSGHYSFDGCLTSQFEQQCRAVCGLPLGSTELLRPTVMVNLLGDLWRDGPPDWTPVLRHPTAKLHLYGKAEARPGRKMGHYCVLGETVETALADARSLQAALAPASPTRT